MRLLLLGGTAWLGRELAAQAVTAGHEVVCVARGQSGQVAPGTRLVTADRDRDDALDGVAKESWDVVVDVSRQPGHVRRAVQQLRCAEHVVLISTGNVYADHVTLGLDESAALLRPLEDDVMTSMEQYGEAKVACEEAVLDAFGDRATIARSGLIGGPGDRSDRTGYWPLRFSHPSGPGGEVLAPDARDLGTAIIDVRDLARWLLLCGTERISGVFNATGSVVRLDEHLATCRALTGHAGEVVWADPAWLVEQGVQHWSGPRSLPHWLPDDERGFCSHVSTRAYDAGLALRPLESTLADNLVLGRGEPDRELGSGLTTVEELRLLRAYTDSSSQ